MTKQIWRNSASVILIAKRDSNSANSASYDRNILPGKMKTSQYDYRVLFLKRAKESKFMPNMYVFPGGVLDRADLSTEWVSMFNKLDKKFLTRFIVPNDKLQAFKFVDPLVNKAGSPQASDSTLPLEIATRICAIREAFEESGVLLARKIIPNDATPPLEFGEANPTVESLPVWRKRVSSNAADFLSLCKEKEVCPDIWALHEWANWLTPTLFTRRFNTLFYTCFLNVTPSVAVDEGEISLSQWFSPSEAIDHFYAQKLVLPPPQNYEIRRLGQIESIEALAKISKDRSLEGVECWLPVIFKTADGNIHILPGDEIYPSKPDFLGLETNQKPIDKTNAEMRRNAKFLNRGEGGELYTFDYKYYCNVESPCGLLPPLCDDNDIQ